MYGATCKYHTASSQQTMEQVFQTCNSTIITLLIQVLSYIHVFLRLDSFFKFCIIVWVFIISTNASQEKLSQMLKVHECRLRLQNPRAAPVSQQLIQGTQLPVWCACTPCMDASCINPFCAKTSVCVFTN